MTVKDLISELKKMPQDASVGFQQHDYDSEMSDSIHYVDKNECDGARHQVVLRG